MKRIDELIKNINEVTQIPFKLKDELGDIYISPSFNSKDLNVEQKIETLNKIFTIIINKNEEKFIPLLSYYISNVIKDTNYEKNIIITDILNGNSVNIDDINNNYQFMLEKFNLILVFVENKVEEAYHLIKQGYDERDTAVLIYQDRILVLGKLESVYEHALSIKETLSSNMSGQKLISYCRVNSYVDIKKCLKKCIKKISLVNRFNLDIDIIGEHDIVFEEIIESIDSECKKELINEFNKGLKKIDNDMIKTIDGFFKCGLNLSEASKELYIHRNTLIYRIEKLQKYTGFDIRNFNEAVIFKTIYTLWKEDNRNK